MARDDYGDDVGQDWEETRGPLPVPPWYAGLSLLIIVVTMGILGPLEASPGPFRAHPVMLVELVVLVIGAHIVMATNRSEDDTEANRD